MDARFASPEACLAAVRRDGTVLEEIPEDLRTEEVCLAAVQAPCSGGFPVLCAVPPACRTEAVCAAAVVQDPASLEFVPMKLRTPELCLAAVRQNGAMLELVPPKARTPEACMAAVLAGGGDDIVFSVPERYRTPALCMASADPDRWKSGWAAARRTAEALPRRFFRAGVLKPEIASYFKTTWNGWQMLNCLTAPDGSFRRVGRRPWSGDDRLESAWENSPGRE